MTNIFVTTVVAKMSFVKIVVDTLSWDIQPVQWPITFTSENVGDVIDVLTNPSFRLNRHNNGYHFIEWWVENCPNQLHLCQIAMRLTKEDIQVLCPAVVRVLEHIADSSLERAKKTLQSNSKILEQLVFLQLVCSWEQSETDKCWLLNELFSVILWSAEHKEIFEFLQSAYRDSYEYSLKAYESLINLVIRDVKSDSFS
jgi:hypothetical protein